MTALKRLVPHTLGDTSETAMTYAMALARTAAAKLHLLRTSWKGGTDITTEDLRGIDPSIEDAGGTPPQGIGATADEKDEAMPRQTALEGLADELSACDGVCLLHLEPLTTLLVRTSYSVYRIIVLQDTTVLVQGGPHFPDVTKGQLNGSGFGGNLLKLGWIGVGLRMEIVSHGERFVTSAVRAITTERNPSICRPQ